MLIEMIGIVPLIGNLKFRGIALSDALDKVNMLSAIMQCKV